MTLELAQPERSRSAQQIALFMLPPKYDVHVDKITTVAQKPVIKRSPLDATITVDTRRHDRHDRTAISSGSVCLGFDRYRFEPLARGSHSQRPGCYAPFLRSSP